MTRRLGGNTHDVAATQREREDKYDADEGFVLPRLQELTPAGGRVEQDRVDLDSLYFDTPGHDLLRHRVTLRRRSGDADTGWQLKVPAGKARTEVRLATDSEDVPAELDALTRGIAAGQPLRQVAVLRTRRVRHRIVAPDGATLFELADDHVRATAFGDAAVLTRWREIEVEVADGEDAGLAKLGKQLTRAGARPSAHPSKLARALRSLDPGDESAAVDRRAVVVADYLRTQQAELVAGDIALRRGHDAIHPTRVATRRLRSTLRTFGDLFDAERAAELDAELAWYADVLGKVRDRQVQRARFAAALDRLPPEFILGPVAADIDQRLHVEQLHYQGDVDTALSSQRYLNLLAEVGTWATTPPLTRPADERTLRKLARRAGRKADKRLRQAVAAVREGADEAHAGRALHRARKATKRARYAVELTTPIRRPKAAKKTIKRYKALQDILGEHQDSVVAAGVLRDFAARAGATPGQNRFTYGLLYCREQHAAREARAAAAAWAD